MKKQSLSQRLNGIKSQARDARKNLDNRILEFTHVGMDQVKNRWSKAAKKLDIDEDIPVVLVERILEKAKSVRESLQADEVIKKTKTRKEAIQKTVVDKAMNARAKTQQRVKAVKTRVTLRRKKPATDA